MLRFNFAINSLLGALLVTPAVTLGVQHNESLETTLKRTLASLDELARIERRLAEGDPSAIADVLRASEPPLTTSNGSPAARDEALTELRASVGKLQRDLDEFESRSSAAALVEAARTPVAAPLRDSPAAPAVDLTFGLDDAQRRRLADRARPVPTETLRAPKATESAGGGLGGAKTAFESQDYAADALRLGRAQYRQGQYAEALASLSSSKEAEAQYWRARCLEKLGREAEAIAAYKQVIERADGGYSAQRAKEDLEFLEWRIDFERLRSKPEGGKP